MGEPAPQTAKAAQVGDAERKLEGDVRMVEEEIRFLVVQGFCVIDKGAVVGLHVPEPTAFPAVSGAT